MIREVVDTIKLPNSYTELLCGFDIRSEIDKHGGLKKIAFLLNDGKTLNIEPESGWKMTVQLRREDDDIEEIKK